MHLFVNSSVHLDLKITIFINHPKNMLVILLNLINYFALAATVSAAHQWEKRQFLNKWFAESKMTHLILVLFLFTLQRIYKTAGG